MFILGGSTHFDGPALAELEIPDAKLRQRVDELSASTMKGGAGSHAYEKLLHPDYSRCDVSPLLSSASA